MADFYAALKTAFDADTALVGGASGPFSALYMGEAPEGEDVPYCVLVPGDEPKTEGTFASIYCRETFSLHVVTATQEAGQDYTDTILLRLDDWETSLTADGLTILSLQYSNRRTTQPEQDRWETAVECEVLYQRAR